MAMKETRSREIAIADAIQRAKDARKHPSASADSHWGGNLLGVRSLIPAL